MLGTLNIKDDVIGSSGLSESDKQFCKRVWHTPMEIYLKRLKSIDFENKGVVLDAGFGLGQWLYALSCLNSNVVGVEYDAARFNFVQNVFDSNNVSNVRLECGSIENMPFSNDSFDAIFCYSVIFCTDYRSALTEFYRVLKPGGKLYFNSNGLGWYLHNILKANGDHSLLEFKMAVQAIKSSLTYYSTNNFIHETYASIVTIKDVVCEDLKSLGFRMIECAPEGDLGGVNLSFFKGEYCNEEGVIEYTCYK